MTLHPDSIAVHAGRDDLASLGVHALPLDLSSTNPLPDLELGGMSYEVLATGGHPFEGGSNVYARLWNPTVARFEEALARLEHAEESVAFSSGMAAMTATLLAVSHETGKRHVVAVRPLYGGTDHLLASGQLGIETTFCSPDGVGHPLTAGRLNTDFPGVVTERSYTDAQGRIVQPYGDFEHASPATPFAFRPYHVELWPVGNVFEKGHRIRVTIVGASGASRPSPPAVNAIRVGGSDGAQLFVPALPGSNLPAAHPR